MQLVNKDVACTERDGMIVRVTNNCLSDHGLQKTIVETLQNPSQHQWSNASQDSIKAACFEWKDVLDG